MLLLQGSPTFALQEGRLTARPEIPEWLPGLPTMPELSIPSTDWRGAWQRSRWELELLGTTLWSSSQEGGGGSSKKPTRPPTMPKTKVEPPDIPPFDPSTLESISPPLEAITLVPGWNFVSIPEQPDDPSAASVLAPIAGKYFKVWAVDNCDTEDPWKLYQPSDLASSDLETIDPTKGMWLKSLEVVDLPSTGTLAPSTKIHLCPGWNLIGFPAAQIRPMPEAMKPFEGSYRRVMTYDATATESQWDVYSTDVPEWGNDLWEMKPGRAYWVLATEEVTAEILNEGPPPEVELFTPDDLTIITEPTEVQGAVHSPFLDHWTLRHRPAGETEWTNWATGDRTTEGEPLDDFDPTLLLNGLYEIQLVAVDWAGQMAESEIRSVLVEGNMKIGNFTLSFVDLAVPVSGLDLEIIRTYDSRDKLKRDFGVGWNLDIRQGSYRNNRAPGDSWQLAEGFLPCDSAIESKQHVTTIRLSDREIYRFALRLVDGLSSTGGGCYAHAEFEYVDGPIPGATLEILGNIRVFQETRSSDRVLDLDTLQTFEPQNVRLTTRDKRVFDLDLDIGVTRVEDPNGNRIDITDEGIFHSVGKAIKFERDEAGRIVKIIDPMEYEYLYAYDDAGDLITTTDPHRSATKFVYDDNHRIVEIIDPRGAKAVRSEYDADGRLVKVTDARGKSIEVKHELDKNREVIVNRLGHAKIFEYDRRGNVVTETDELGNATNRTYDGKDRLLTETDPLGNTTTNVYNADGDLESITDPLGHVMSFEYNDPGNPTKITDPRGNAMELRYDGSGNLTSFTGPLDAKTIFTYDSKGNVSSETDALGHATLYEYDSSGNQTMLTNPLGHKTIFEYNKNGILVSEQSHRTRLDGSSEILKTVFAVDALGRETAVTLPNGSTTRIFYDALGTVTSTIDALGRTTNFSIDTAGRVVQRVYADGTTDRHQYDAEGRLVAISDREDRLTTFRYDSAGQLLTTIYPDGATTSLTYDSAGRLVSRLDERGAKTSYLYDAAGRRTQTIDQFNQSTFFHYDESGNLESIIDREGSRTEFVYDDANNLVKTRLPDKQTVETEYDKLGRKVSETDQAGRKKQYLYDSSGRLIEIIGPLGQVVRYAYDEQNNRTLQTDPGGRTTRFSYDEVGRQTSRILPDGSREIFEYDLVGNLVLQEDFRGTKFAYTYDENNRPTRRESSDGTSISTTYTSSGQRATVNDSRGLTVYNYDKRGRPISVTTPEGWILRSVWDGTGNRTLLTVERDKEIVYNAAYSYDLLGRNTAINDGRGSVYAFEYDATGRRTSMIYPNGVVTLYGYDPNGRLISIRSETEGGDIIQSFDYTLESTGNRKSVKEKDGTSRVWSYDALDRLIQERVEDASGELLQENKYSYDVAGNRIWHERRSLDGSFESAFFVFDSRDRLLSKVTQAGNVTQYSWDPNGNLIQIRSPAGRTIYDWDPENRLVAATLPDGQQIQSLYDADGIRTASKNVSSDGQTQSAVQYVTDTFSSLSRVVAEADINGKIYASYILNEGPLSSLHGSQERYFHADHTGSTRVLTDSSSLPVERYQYHAFGDLSGDRLPRESITFLYAGEPQQLLTRLTYLRNRWLDNSLGRFVSGDPLQNSFRDIEEQHPYIYARNNPINRQDPLGLSSMPEVSAALSQLGSLSSITFRLLSILDKLQTTIEALSLIRQFFGLVMNGNLGNILSNSLAILKDPQSFGSTDDFNIQEIIESLSKNQGAIATAAFKSWYQWSRSNWNRIRGYGVNMPTPIGTPINQKIQLPEKFHLGGKPLFLILGGRTGGTITGLSVVARLAGGDVKNIWRMDFHRWTPGHPIGGNKKELNAWRDGKFHFHVMRPPQ